MRIILAFRPINLIITGLLQWIFYTRVLEASASQNQLQLVLQGSGIFIFIGCTIFLAASGYLINDYFDYETDKLNSKSSKWSDKHQYLVAYYIVLIIGAILAHYLAFNLGSPFLALIYYAAAAMLFIYSSHWKAIPLAGNILVSIFCAAVVLILAFAERRMLFHLELLDASKFNFVVFIFIFYAAFAYLLTMIRELIKDIEDIYGDRQQGLSTFPVMHGIERTRILALFHGFVMIGLMCLSWIYFPAFRQMQVVISLAVLLMIMMLFLQLSIFFAQSKKNFYHVSLLCKFIMITGILFLISLT